MALGDPSTYDVRDQCSGFWFMFMVKVGRDMLAIELCQCFDPQRPEGA